VNPSLRLLLRLRLRGRVRLYAKRFGALQSAFLTVVGVIIGFGCLSSMIGVMIAGRSTRSATYLENVERLVPAFIVAAWVSTLLVGSKTGALAFTAADTDQLFPGPFRRRDLVLYRICVQSFWAVISSVLAGFWVIMQAGTLLGGWLAFALFMLFLQYSNIAMSIARDAGGRNLKLAVGIPALAVIAYLAVAIGALSGDFTHVVPALRAIRESRAVSIVLAPLEPFGRAYAATDTRTAMLNIAGCLGLVLLMVALILRLDTVSLEASLAQSQKVQAALERRRAGRLRIRTASSVQVPMPRVLGRAAPIAWRHATGVVRSGTWVLVPGAFVAGVLLGGLPQKGMLAIMPTFGIMVLFALPNLLRFDFRADLDQIDLLKTLPLAPSAVAVGQLAAPVALAALMAWGILLGAGVRHPEFAGRFALAGALAPLAGALLMACENILFLLYPTRAAASGIMDVRHLARGIVSQIAKMITVAAAAAPAALIIWGSRALGFALAAGVAAAAGVMLVECVGMVYAVAWAFNRFDPANDMPA
jgi:hypothetical protein